VTEQPIEIPSLPRKRESRQGLVSPQGPESSPLRRVLMRLVLVLATMLLAILAIGIAFFMGREIKNDQWPILITATGVATYIAIAVINAKHAFIVWMVTAPFARFVYLNIELGKGIPDMSLNRVMTGVLLVLVLATAAGQRRRLARFTWADLMLLLFGVGAVVSVPSSLTPLKTSVQSFFDLVFIPIAVYFFARNLLTSREDVKTMIYALFIIGIYLGFLATREQLTGSVWFYPEDRSLIYSGSIRRVVGLMGNPACMALSIAMIVPWGWYLYLNARRNRALVLALVVLMMAGCYFCMNRSGWAGLALGLVIMALFIKRFRRIFALLLLIVVIIAGVYWAVIVSSTVVQARLKAQGPIEYRLDTWRVALSMLRSNLTFGVGYENFGTLYKLYGYWDPNAPVVPYPHNTYLWILLMGGAVAFVPFLLFLLVTAVSALRTTLRGDAAPGAAPALASSRAELAGVFLASMAAMFAPAFVGDIFYCYYAMMLTFFILGALNGVMSGSAKPAEVAAGGAEGR